MRGVAGTLCVLYYDTEDGTPAEGDFVRTDAGSCYRIDAVRPSPRRPTRFNLTVTRLEHDAVQAGAPGVWPLRWYRRI
jgi:hypothetical protein